MGREFSSEEFAKAEKSVNFGQEKNSSPEGKGTGVEFGDVPKEVSQNQERFYSLFDSDLPDNRRIPEMKIAYEVVLRHDRKLNNGSNLAAKLLEKLDKDTIQKITGAPGAKSMKDEISKLAAAGFHSDIGSSDRPEAR